MDAVEEWEQTVLCTECNKWCHNGVLQIFVCPRYAREGEGGDGNRDKNNPELVVEGGMLSRE